MKLTRWGEDQRSYFIPSNIEPMLLDTGAAKSQITASDITNSFKVLSEEESHGAFGSKILKTVEIPELIVGDCRHQNLQATLDNTHGILGMDFLMGMSIHLDFAHDEFAFGAYFTDGMDLFLGKKGHIYISCAIGDMQVWTLFDTGASATIVDQALSDTHPEFFQPLGIDQGKDWTGTQREAQLVGVNQLSIASVPFGEHEAGIMDLSGIKQYLDKPVQIILGATTMELAIWDFDFKNRKWKFKLNRE